MQRRRGRPDAALGGPGDRDEPATVCGVRGLLTRHRSRIVRDHCAGSADTGLEGLGRERERDDVAQAGLHRRAQQAGLLGRRPAGSARPRGTPRRGRAPGRAPACRRARRRAARRPTSRRRGHGPLVDLGGDLDDLEFRSARLGGRAVRGLGLGDRDQEPRAHRATSPGVGGSSPRSVARQPVARVADRVTSPGVGGADLRARSLASRLPGSLTGRRPCSELRPDGGAERAVAAQAADTASGRSALRPQAGPRFDASHQFTREAVGIGGADHAFDELAGAPVVRTRRASPPPAPTGRSPSCSLTVSAIQRSSAWRAATTRRLGRTRRGSGIAARPSCTRCTAGPGSWRPRRRCRA